MAKASSVRHDAGVGDVLKQLIITGDDFGRSPAVNGAIAAFHDAGALSQASLMVAEPHAGAARDLTARRPDLCVGLHLTLCAGRATEASSLTDAAGNLPASPAWAGLRCAFDRRTRRDLEAEIRRQFERFLALGFPPAYWDGHAHLHLHPTVLRLTLPVARELGFRFMRLVREPGAPAILPWIFQKLSHAAIPALRDAGIGFADRTLGLRRTGHISPAWLESVLKNLPAGVSELYLHPGAEPLLPAPPDLRGLAKNILFTTCAAIGGQRREP